MTRLIVVGCGRIGRMHTSHLLEDFPQCDVVAIFDEALEQEYCGVPVYKSARLDDYLVSHNVDAALIAAPSSYHATLLRQLLAHQLAVFCEKPVSFDLEELEQLMRLPGFVQVGLNRRWDSDFQDVKKAIDEGHAGEVQLIKITNRDPHRPSLDFVSQSGGLFYDFTIHDFDMVHYLMNEEVSEVYAQGRAIIDPRLKAFNDIDTAIISLKLANGTLVVIDASRETNAGYDQRIEVFGSKACLSVDNLTPHQLHRMDESGQRQESPWPDFSTRYKSAYKAQLSGFLNALSQGISSVSLKDMHQAVKIANACTQSLEKNTPVFL